MSGSSERRVAHRDRKRAHCETSADWRAWLDAHYTTHEGGWLVSWKAHSVSPG